MASDRSVDLEVGNSVLINVLSCRYFYGEPGCYQKVVEEWQPVRESRRPRGLQYKL